MGSFRHHGASPFGILSGNRNRRRPSHRMTKQPRPESNRAGLFIVSALHHDLFRLSLDDRFRRQQRHLLAFVMNFIAYFNFMPAL